MAEPNAGEAPNGGPDGVDPNCWTAGAGAGVVELPKCGADGADPNCGPEDAGARFVPNMGWLDVDVVDDDDDPNIKGCPETGGRIVVVADPKVVIVPDAGGAGAADVDIPKPVLWPNAAAPNVAPCPIPA